MFHPRHVLAPLVLAILVSGFGWAPALAASPTPAASPAPVSTPFNGCESGDPEFEMTIDPRDESTFAPTVQMRVNDLALPAAGRFFWGNGQYGVANINQVGGGTNIVKQITPIYDKPGEYIFRSQLTDSCEKVHEFDYPIAAPVNTTGIDLVCPGTIDISGFCLVAINKPVTFEVSGGPDAGWRWDTDSAPGARTLTRTFSKLGEFWVQARVITPDGMLISPILRVAPKSPSKPPITEVHVPPQVAQDEEFSASFVIPPGAEAATPSIYLDSVKVADGISVPLTLQAGTHVVTFVLTWPDESTVSRQAGVLATAPPPPEGPDIPFLISLALGAALGIGILFLLLLFLARRLRRQHADRRLAGHGRWLRAALRAANWDIIGPTIVTITKQDRQCTLSATRPDGARFEVTRPYRTRKWIWQDLLDAIITVHTPAEGDPDWLDPDRVDW